jgi:hypothetical protein
MMGQVPPGSQRLAGFLKLRELGEIQPPRVDRHPQRRVDVHRMERPDLLHRRDTTGRGDLVLRRGAQAPEPVQIGSLQHAFLVDLVALKPAAQRLKLTDHVLGV